MIELRKRPLLEQADWLSKKPIPVELGEIVGQLIVARGLVDRLASVVRRLQPQQMGLR